MWTRSRLPLRTIGMRRWPSRDCRRASTSTWKNLAATAEIWKAGANGEPAALFGTQHRDRRKDSRGRDRQAVPRESLVQQCEEVHWHRQRSARAGTTGLGLVARPGATASL